MKLIPSFIYFASYMLQNLKNEKNIDKIPKEMEKLVLEDFNSFQKLIDLYYKENLKSLVSIGLNKGKL